MPTNSESPAQLERELRHGRRGNGGSGCSVTLDNLGAAAVTAAFAPPLLRLLSLDCSQGNYTCLIVTEARYRDPSLFCESACRLDGSH